MRARHRIAVWEDDGWLQFLRVEDRTSPTAACLVQPVQRRVESWDGGLGNHRGRFGRAQARDDARFQPGGCDGDVRCPRRAPRCLPSEPLVARNSKASARLTTMKRRRFPASDVQDAEHCLDETTWCHEGRSCSTRKASVHCRRPRRPLQC